MYDMTTTKNSQMNFMNGMFGQLSSGCCRLSMNGAIAVRTKDNNYRTYDVDKGILTNCTGFVFDIGEDFFFVIPTNKVERGDIILVGGSPRCVISVQDNCITAINYNDSTIEQIVPERYEFLGATYFYGKIVSMFGNLKGTGTNGIEQIMKYKMIQSMMKSQNGSMDMNSMLPFLLIGGGNMMGNLFSGIFDGFSQQAPAQPTEDTVIMEGGVQ